MPYGKENFWNANMQTLEIETYDTNGLVSTHVKAVACYRGCNMRYFSCISGVTRFKSQTDLWCSLRVNSQRTKYNQHMVL